jgi:hypothetical protein
MRINALRNVAFLAVAALVVTANGTRVATVGECELLQDGTGVFTGYNFASCYEVEQHCIYSMCGGSIGANIGGACWPDTSELYGACCYCS